MTETVIVKKLNKSYGQKPVIKDLSFSVFQGEIVGLLGANGAGKSTTINILSTIPQSYFSIAHIAVLLLLLTVFATAFALFIATVFDRNTNLIATGINIAKRRILKGEY